MWVLFCHDAGHFPTDCSLTQLRSRAHITSDAVATAMGASLVGWAFAANRTWFDRHFFSSYCAASTAALRLETLARWVAVGLAIAVVGFFRQRLERWLSRRGSREIARTAGGVAVAVVMALVVGDIVLRVKAKPILVENEPGLPPMRVDENGNYAPIPSRTKKVTLGARQVEYAIDSDGNRAPRADHVVDRAAPTILFTGESFTIGWGIAYEKTYPALVAAALGAQPVNLAVTGFANDQAYWRLQNALPKLDHPVAIVTLVLAVQLERNVDNRREHLALSKDGRLELVPRSTSMLATSPLRKLLPYHSDEAIPLTAAILRATAELAASRGARPVFVFTNFGAPCTTDEQGSSWLERSLFAGISAPHVRVDLSPSLTIAPPNEVHPNERGHELLADAIVFALRSNTVASP
jgi:hypothetical protein